MNSISGYIDLNTKKVHKFDVYEHLKFIRDNYMGNSEINDIINELDDIKKSCGNAEESGEHPEWHVYEIASGQGMWDITKILMHMNVFRFNCRNKILYIDIRRDMYYGNNLKDKFKKLFLMDDDGLDFKRIVFSFTDTYKTLEYPIREFLK